MTGMPGARSAAQLAAIIDAKKVPTDQQLAVIGAGLEPQLVVAGAGSGKTETLSMRMAYVIDNAHRWWADPITPDQILCLTFTRKAAQEIAERAAARLNAVFGVDPQRLAPSVSTYNAYAGALVAEHGLRIGVDPDATILTNAALWQLSSSLVESWTGELDSSGAVSTVVSAIPELAAAMNDHAVTPERLRAWVDQELEYLHSLPKKQGDRAPGTMTQALAGELPRLTTLRHLAALVEEFAERKRRAGAIDFSDQVSLASRLALLPDVQASERARYKLVLLDEFQDTSAGQLELFARIFGVDHPVMAVGDPHQAIYGFRGASAASLKGFVDAFGGPDRVVQRSLNISWRNSERILAAANTASAPLRAEAAVHVEPLALPQVRPGMQANPGTVDSQRCVDLESEAREAVSWLVARRATAQRAGAEGTAAILCRARSQFTPMVAALREAGVPYEVVGLGGLLDTPAIVELVALLEAAHDPSRGDSLMRLLTGGRVALGPRDLLALKDWADHLAGPRDSREVEASIIDALTTLPPAAWVSRSGRRLTAAARERLLDLARAVQTVREHTYLPLSELIALAERTWGLDIEVDADGTDRGRGRAIDAFQGAARSFAAGAPLVTLGAFLAWLTAAKDKESGLEMPVREPRKDAVQVLTIHGAKGLEWDVVVAPGLNDGQFPKVTCPRGDDDPYRDAGWLTGTGVLPWPLRRDAADLPEWALHRARDHAGLSKSMTDFRAAAGHHRVAEERRLFYVAVTRARWHLLLSGTWFATGKTKLKPSLYVQELVDAGLLDTSGWDPEPTDDKREPAPPLTALWPLAPTPREQGLRALAAEVEAAMNAGATVTDDLPYAQEATAMLAERDQRHERLTEVAMPKHLSTSALVSLSRDREAFVEQLRRPVPLQPTDAARRGSELHTWIEGVYGMHSLFETDDLGPDEGVGVDLAALKETFLSSEWAERRPSDVEVDVHVRVAGVTVRSRIDAVFPPGNGLERVTVVDWKSGQPARDDRERAAREVQLAVYRLAWAEWKGLDVADVDAAFYYVAHDATVFPERLLTRAEIEGLLSAQG